MNNESDYHLDAVLETVDLLLQRHGIFHAKIHFSSGQVTPWRVQDT